MSDNVVYLKFRNELATNSEFVEFIVCAYCKNKTYTLTCDDPKQFPTLKCAACGSHIGRVGWADQDNAEAK